MIATTTPFPRAAIRAGKRRPRQAASVIDKALREANEAGSTRDLTPYPVLTMLASLARSADHRSRSITLHGTRFKLVHELWKKVVICPRTGRRLVGVLDL